MIRCIRIWTNDAGVSSFEERAAAHGGGWLPKPREIVPTDGIDFKTDADACRRTSADTAPVLGLQTVRQDI